MAETNRERAHRVLDNSPGIQKLTHREHSLLADRITALLDERDREHDPLALAARVTELEGVLSAMLKVFTPRSGPPGPDMEAEHRVWSAADAILSSPSPSVEAVRKVLRVSISERKADRVLQEGIPEGATDDPVPPHKEPEEYWMECEDRRRAAVEGIIRDFPALVAGLEEG